MYTFVLQCTLMHTGLESQNVRRISMGHNHQGIKHLEKTISGVENKTRHQERAVL